MLCRAVSQTARLSAIRPARCTRQTVRTMAFLSNKNEQLCGQARCEGTQPALQLAMKLPQGGAQQVEQAMQQIGYIRLSALVDTCSVSIMQEVC